MRGKIQAAKPSQSGKTLSVNVDGTWYSSKAFELQQHVGKEIVGDTSDSDYNGQTIHWLNSYTLVDGTPAPQAERSEPGQANGSKAMSHYQPMISNICAALIAAKEPPSALRLWYVAAKEVLEEDPSVPF